MKAFLIAACIAYLSASNLQAADPPRDAAAILKDYDEVKLPNVDPKKTKNPQYVRDYLQERAAATDKQNGLAEELYRSHSEHPRAVPLMATRLMNMMRSRDSAKAMPEIEQFVNDHPREEQSANLLLMLAQRTSAKERRLTIYRQIVADYPDSRAAKTAEGNIRQVEGIGKSFELAFTDAITGKPISIKDLRGKVVVVDFWATWCGPCVAEMPKMKELYTHYKDSGVEFIGVSLDGPGEGLNKLKTFVEEKGIDWPQYYQGNGWQSEFSQSWGISGIPTVFAIDAKGKLYSTEARGKLEKLIPELIEKRDSSRHGTNEAASTGALE